jgi:hypothetical protein
MKIKARWNDLLISFLIGGAGYRSGRHQQSNNAEANVAKTRNETSHLKVARYRAA